MTRRVDAALYGVVNAPTVQFIRLFGYDMRIYMQYNISIV